jgi:hypothetical protein
MALIRAGMVQSPGQDSNPIDCRCRKSHSDG